MVELLCRHGGIGWVHDDPIVGCLLDKPPCLVVVALCLDVFEVFGMVAGLLQALLVTMQYDVVFSNASRYFLQAVVQRYTLPHRL